MGITFYYNRLYLVCQSFRLICLCGIMNFLTADPTKKRIAKRRYFIAGTHFDDGFQGNLFFWDSSRCTDIWAVQIADRRMWRERSYGAYSNHPVNILTVLRDANAISIKWQKSQLFHSLQWKSWLFTFCVWLTCSAPFSVMRHPRGVLFVFRTIEWELYKHCILIHFCPCFPSHMGNVS